MNEHEHDEQECVDQSDSDQVMDALVAGSRIEKGVVMDDICTLTNDQRADIRTKFHSRRAAGDVTLAQAANGIGAQKSTLSQIVNGKYPDKGRGAHNIDQTLRKLDGWMAQRDATAQAPKRSRFVLTAVAEEIRAVCDTAVFLETMGIIYGPSGIGKSLTLEALLPRFPGSMLLTVTDSSNTVTSCLKELMARLGIDARKARAPMRLAVCNHLRNSQRLLLFDEAHLADLRLLNTLRQVHDDTGCPIVLSGQPSLAKKLLHGRGDDSMGATLYSRVGISRDLTERCRQSGGAGEPLFTVGDVRKVFAKSAIRIARDAMDWLVGLANVATGGHLRDADRVLRLALRIAQTSAQPKSEITVKDLLQASRALLGIRGADELAQRIRQHKEVA